MGAGILVAVSALNRRAWVAVIECYAVQFLVFAGLGLLLGGLAEATPHLPSWAFVLAAQALLFAGLAILWPRAVRGLERRRA